MASVLDDVARAQPAIVRNRPVLEDARRRVRTEVQHRVSAEAVLSALRTDLTGPWRGDLMEVWLDSGLVGSVRAPRWAEDLVSASRWIGQPASQRSELTGLLVSELGGAEMGSPHPWSEGVTVTDVFQRDASDGEPRLVLRTAWVDQPRGDGPLLVVHPDEGMVEESLEELRGWLGSDPFELDVRGGVVEAVRCPAWAEDLLGADGWRGRTTTGLQEAMAARLGPFDLTPSTLRPDGWFTSEVRAASQPAGRGPVLTAAWLDVGPEAMILRLGRPAAT
ncbi:MAG: hypothetical protein ACR2JF_01290 [Iamia sp.]